MKAVAETLGVSRSNLIERLKARSKPRGSYHKAEDAELLPVIRRPTISSIVTPRQNILGPMARARA